MMCWLACDLVYRLQANNLISHIHKKRLTREELLELQPRLAEAHEQGKIQLNDDNVIVSIVKGTWLYDEPRFSYVLTLPVTTQV
jgi:hypothetical protein